MIYGPAVPHLSPHLQAGHAHAVTIQRRVISNAVARPDVSATDDIFRLAIR